MLDCIDVKPKENVSKPDIRSIFDIGIARVILPIEERIVNILIKEPIIISCNFIVSKSVPCVTILSVFYR